MAGILGFRLNIIQTKWKHKMQTNCPKAVLVAETLIINEICIVYERHFLNRSIFCGLSLGFLLLCTFFFCSWKKKLVRNIFKVFFLLNIQKNARCYFCLGISLVFLATFFSITCFAYVQVWIVAVTFLSHPSIRHIKKQVAGRIRKKKSFILCFCSKFNICIEPKKLKKQQPWNIVASSAHAHPPY